MHMLTVTDSRLPQGHMHVAPDLGHEHIAVDLAANRVLALRCSVQDVIVREARLLVRILEVLARVATPLVKLLRLHAGEAVAGRYDVIACAEEAPGVQVELDQVPRYVYLVFSHGVNRVDRDLVTTKVREGDVQANGQLLVQRGVHDYVINHLDSEVRAELGDKQNRHGDDRHQGDQPATLSLDPVVVVNLGVHIEPLQLTQKWRVVLVPLPHGAGPGRPVS
mmetsp:Transcript_5987/g.13684  ORF Transcript_5987/g.13684 Transcript_5987/m.13684 type:complete len:222 (+) Transcript_5987:708-1373(+)